ncbi:hypothetical protein CEXT_486741 [Caerostris extrusa]|uniref:Ycf15 n=1 Tax=Caerostris extrusa TaxID=172846 RepID=A0AAV4MF87_CAEEX|nr:hypothetical protein CEXT_486741 [Caerostris extrusa]
MLVASAWEQKREKGKDHTEVVSLQGVYLPPTYLRSSNIDYAATLLPFGLNPSNRFRASSSFFHCSRIFDKKRPLTRINKF